MVNNRKVAVIYYGMDDKYSGCNIVESVVTSAPVGEEPAEKQKPNSERSHFIMRLLISALIIGFIVVLHYFPSLPFASGVTEVLRKVFCVDVFGRATFGLFLG